MGFGDSLENLRNKRGISVRELSRRLEVDVSPNTVGAWIAGSDPRLSEAMAVARFFEVKLGEMIEEAPVQEMPDDEMAVLRNYRALKRRGVLNEDAAIEGLAWAAHGDGNPDLMSQLDTTDLPMIGRPPGKKPRPKRGKQRDTG